MIKSWVSCASEKKEGRTGGRENDARERRRQVRKVTRKRRWERTKGEQEERSSCIVSCDANRSRKGITAAHRASLSVKDKLSRASMRSIVCRQRFKNRGRVCLIRNKPMVPCPKVWLVCSFRVLDDTKKRVVMHHGDTSRSTSFPIAKRRDAGRYKGKR